jgi:hypothetical protein
MSQLKRLAIGGLAAIAIGSVASSALAMETGNFQDRLNGASIGLPLGAAPPPGLYTGLGTVYVNSPPPAPAGIGHSTGNACIPVSGGSCARVVSFAQAVPLLWVPGWNFLGATYTASIVQAFYAFTACGVAGSGGNCSGGAPISGGGFVYANTFIQPINLSWNLGGGWFVAGAFGFMPPDGTHQTGTPNPDFWTFEPSLAFSYLDSSWVLSANFFYDIATQSQGVCCASARITSGNALFGDFTVLYKIGKWTIGPVGYFEEQTTPDTGGCTPAPGVNLCGQLEQVAVGGLIGYDFGPVSVQVWVTDNLVGKNVPLSPGTFITWSRLSFKVWEPEAKPVLTKN